jgi:hypothetical protein
VNYRGDHDFQGMSDIIDGEVLHHTGGTLAKEH